MEAMVMIVAMSPLLFRQLLLPLPLQLASRPQLAPPPLRQIPTPLPLPQLRPLLPRPPVPLRTSVLPPQLPPRSLFLLAQLLEL